MVSNAKAKIRRTNKKYGVDLHGDVALPKLENFSSREVFNRWKDEIKSFTNRNNQQFQFEKNQYGVVANKKRLREIRRHTKEAQELAKRQIEEIKNKPVMIDGKQVSTVGQEMMKMKKPKAGISVPNDFDFSSIRTQQRLEQVEQSMIRKTNRNYYDRRMEQMKTNFLVMLAECFNSDANELIQKIMKMSAEDFYELYLMNEEFNFEEYYNNKDLDMKPEQINDMMNIVENYEEGNVDFSLKGF